ADVSTRDLDSLDLAAPAVGREGRRRGRRTDVITGRGDHQHGTADPSEVDPPARDMMLPADELVVLVQIANVPVIGSPGEVDVVVGPGLEHEEALARFTVAEPFGERHPLRDVSGRS